MPDIDPRTPLYLLTEPFRKALSDVLSEALGAGWSVSSSANEAPASDDAASIFFRASASGGLHGNATLQLKRGDAVLLAQKLLAESSDPAGELSSPRQQAVEDLLRKMAGLAATGFTPRFGEVVLQLNRVEAPAEQGAVVILSASEASTGSLSIKLQLDAEMLASIPAQQPEAAATTAAAAAAATASAPVSADNNLDLLLNVDLNLTLRFGQRTLTLREIMDLSSGSIIELDRQVQEPADLLLGNKLIAKGEVVIVDGNYGLRITEVSDPQPGTDRMGLSR
ncbi:MAG TPA: flagellar motor switch protein FliN [Terriglobales bacterium]|nr:flagellar motor switch protein FliN [Terriglobales bacterium]